MAFPQAWRRQSGGSAQHRLPVYPSAAQALRGTLQSPAGRPRRPPNRRSTAPKPALHVLRNRYPAQTRPSLYAWAQRQAARRHCKVNEGFCASRKLFRRFAVRLAVGRRLYSDFPVLSSTGERLIKSYIAAHRQPARKPPPHSPQRLTKRCAYGKLSAPASAMGRMKEDVFMRRFFAGLLPLVCLLLTACAEPPTGELAPVDVYLPPETEVRGDAPAERTLTLDGETFTLAYRCTTSSPRWPFALDVYADESGALTAEYRSGEDRPAAVSRSGPAAGRRAAVRGRAARTRGGVAVACGVSVDGTRSARPSAFPTGRCCCRITMCTRGISCATGLTYSSMHTGAYAFISRSPAAGGRRSTRAAGRRIRRKSARLRMRRSASGAARTARSSGAS